ncbi:MAG: hypothetical protein Q8O00_00575, partial [Holophaga sp.]|nr:hypothetical protein [Holophaga sp.]
MFRALLLGFLLASSLGLRAQAVFTLTTEATATGSDGTSASSKVTVRLGPGTEWHGHFGTNFGGQDARTPTGLYKLRGGLYGLREAEPMCFGILSHKGSARAGGRVLGGPGSIQQSSSGNMWTLKEDAARFTREKDGGVFRCAPVIYMDEEPPEFGLLSPGAYDFGSAANDRYRSLLAFKLTNEDLRNLIRMRKVQQGSFTSEDGSVTQSFKLTLEGAPPEDETEVIVTVEDFDGWIPKGNLDEPKEAGNSLTFHITAHKKGSPDTPRKANLVLTLPEVSKNKGVCGNWPKQAGAAEGLRFVKEDFPTKDGLLWKSRTEAATDSPLEKVDVRLRCFDYGGWATLHVEAKDEAGNAAKVTIRGKETPDLRIPLDEDRNRIADAWEPGTAYGKAKNWDEETAGGQDGKGDNISLYDEYRGLVVPDGQGDRAFKRMSPTRKEIFLLDPSQEFMTAKWERISGIRAIRLDDSMVDPAGNPGPGKSPLVNFNAEDRGTQPFYALKIVVRNDNAVNNESPAYAEMAKGTAWCIKNAIAVNIFPARFQHRIEEDFFQLEKAILEPNSPEGVDLRTNGPNQQVTYADAYAAWTRLQDPALRKT